MTETIEETPAEVVDLTSETNAKTKDKATKTKKVTRIVTRKIKKKRQKPAEEKLADNSETKPNIPLICQQFPISGFKRVDEFIADLFLYANSKTISHLLNLRQSPEKIMVGGELILPKTEIARRLNIGVEKLADNEFVKKDTTILREGFFESFLRVLWAKAD